MFFGKKQDATPMLRCPQCQHIFATGERTCPDCGVPLVDEAEARAHLKLPDRCPKCGAQDSFEISGERKAFGTGKAVVGFLVVGPLGLLAGAAGTRRLVYRCRECGYTIE